MKYLFISFLFISNVAATENVKDLVKALQKHYESIQTIESDFIQIKRNKRFGEEKYAGKVAISRPGKMRWDYSEPKGRTLVSDGKAMTLFDPSDNQALVSEISKEQDLPPPFSFLWGNGNLEKDFNISFSKDEKTKTQNSFVLEIIPKKEIPNVSKVLLWIQDAQKPTVVQTRVFFVFGDENEIQFQNIKLNTEISTQRFKFDLPKGVMRVDAGLRKN